MEPMTLGSPNNSFNASAFDSSAANNSQFLPSFLLGSDPGNSSTYASPRLASPTKPQVTKFQTSPTQYSMSDRYNQQSINSPVEKHEGPPTLSLADYSLIHFQRQGSDCTDASGSLMNTKDFIEENFSENWVTVFGFTPSQLDLVLSYFVRFGQIIDKKHSINGGNWIHIRYSNRREAQAALSHNGKQISSHLMVGVVSKRDKHNLDSSRRSLGLHSKTDIPHGPALNSSSFMNPCPSIRRLTVTNNENEVVPLTNVPTKSSGVVSKTMEYLFGW